MIARLSEELVRELERAGDVPLRVENPNNHKLYVIIAEERFSDGRTATPSDASDEWTEARNARRFALIDKQIAGTISADEVVELNGLQQAVDTYLQRVAPLPLAAVRDLHERLRSSLQSFSGT